MNQEGELEKMFKEGGISREVYDILMKEKKINRENEAFNNELVTIISRIKYRLLY